MNSDFLKKNLRQNDPQFQLFKQYFHRCIGLGRALNETELREFREHPDYTPAFERYRIAGDKVFLLYEYARKNEKANLGKGETIQDQVGMLGFVVEDLKEQTDPPLSLEFSVRVINLLSSLRT